MNENVKWRDLPTTFLHDEEDVRDDVLFNSSTLQAIAKASNGRTPIFLAPPTDGLDAWTLSVGRIDVNGKCPTEVHIIQSSVPFSQALDELCEMLARWTLSEQDDVVALRPSSPSPSVLLQDICRTLGSVSLQDTAEDVSHPQMCDETDETWDDGALVCSFVSVAESDDESSAEDLRALSDISLVLEVHRDIRWELTDGVADRPGDEVQRYGERLLRLARDVPSSSISI